MEQNDFKQITHRRGFLGILASVSAAFGLATLASPLQLSAQQKAKTPAAPTNAADAWFDNIKGKHRMVFDVTRPHEILPFAWPRIFLLSNAATGSPETDCGVVVVLRHKAIAYAMEDRLWEKYKFGELFKIKSRGKGGCHFANKHGINTKK